MGYCRIISPEYRYRFSPPHLLNISHKSESGMSHPISLPIQYFVSFLYPPVCFNVTRYVFSRNTDLLKWKWPELRSVDLKVVVTPPDNNGNGDKGVAGTGGGPSLVVHLMCGGPDGSEIDLTKRGKDYVGLGTFDAYRLLADVEDAPAQGRGGIRASIAEVAYDAGCGVWTYLHLRRDKSVPNFIDTVLGVFVEQAEAVSLEELQYRLASRPEAGDDFGQQLAKMKRKLLDWQAKGEQVERK